MTIPANWSELLFGPVPWPLSRALARALSWLRRPPRPTAGPWPPALPPRVWLVPSRKQDMTHWFVWRVVIFSINLFITTVTWLVIISQWLSLGVMHTQSDGWHITAFYSHTKRVYFCKVVVPYRLRFTLVSQEWKIVFSGPRPREFFLNVCKSTKLHKDLFCCNTVSISKHFQ